MSYRQEIVGGYLLLVHPVDNFWPGLPRLVWPQSGPSFVILEAGVPVYLELSSEVYRASPDQAGSEPVQRWRLLADRFAYSCRSFRVRPPPHPLFRNPPSSSSYYRV